MRDAELQLISEMRRCSPALALGRPRVPCGALRLEAPIDLHLARGFDVWRRGARHLCTRLARTRSWLPKLIVMSWRCGPRGPRTT